MEMEGSILVVGMGQTGLSCVKHLSRSGFTFSIADSRDDPPNLDEIRKLSPSSPMYLGYFNEEVFAGHNNIILSPGVSVKDNAIVAAKEAGSRIFGDIELFARIATKPIIAITGTNGKSTVTELLTHMARSAGLVVESGGNIGTPALDLLQNESPDIYVLEISSYQLETIYSLNPVAAVVLNITPDHLDRYRSFSEYKDTKSRVFNGNGVMVINADDKNVTSMIKRSRKVIQFTSGTPISGIQYGLSKLHEKLYLMCGSRKILCEDELFIKGKHNLMNALAAMALAEAVSIPVEDQVKALQEFRGLSHRMQFVGSYKDVKWYNDSKGTNVGATTAAINETSGNIILIAGGLAKGQDFTPLRDALVGKSRSIFLFGKDSGCIAQALENVAPLKVVSNLVEAVREAKIAAKTGDSVLFSPACASFDMYESYEERGKHFIDLVSAEYK